MTNNEMDIWMDFLSRGTLALTAMLVALVSLFPVSCMAQGESDMRLEITYITESSYRNNPKSAMQYNLLKDTTTVCHWNSDSLLRSGLFDNPDWQELSYSYGFGPASNEPFWRSSSVLNRLLQRYESPSFEIVHSLLDRDQSHGYQLVDFLVFGPVDSTMPERKSARMQFLALYSTNAMGFRVLDSASIEQPCVSGYCGIDSQRLRFDGEVVYYRKYGWGVMQNVQTGVIDTLCDCIPICAWNAPGLLVYIPAERKLQQLDDSGDIVVSEISTEMSKVVSVYAIDNNRYVIGMIRTSTKYRNAFSMHVWFYDFSMQSGRRVFESDLGQIVDVDYQSGNSR